MSFVYDDIKTMNIYDCVIWVCVCVCVVYIMNLLVRFLLPDFSSFFSVYVTYVKYKAWEFYTNEKKKL